MAFAGCREASLIELPGYQCTVPEDVPERLVVSKHIGSEVVTDGRATYAWAHRQGWAECWQRHLAGQFDPTDKTAEPYANQEPELAMRGRRDGFEQCRRRLADPPQ